jgi:hypothetical protein
MKYSVLYAGIFFLLANTMFAEDKTNTNDFMPKISGMAQVIGQMDDRGFDSKSDIVYNNILKVRVGVEKEVYKDFFVRADIQDSRLMGQTTASVMESGKHNLDLLQGYVYAKNIFNTGFGVKVGRFQMQYGTERFIGRSFWHKDERKFDGGILSYENKMMKADFFYTYHNDNMPYLLKAIPDNYPVSEDIVGNNSEFFGTWIEINLNTAGNLHLFAFTQADRKSIADAVMNTIGINHFWSMGNLKTTVEAASQFGEFNMKGTDGHDINSYLIALSADYKINRFSANVGLTMISGTEKGSKEFSTFNNTMGSKHKFLGNMDYFLVIPVIGVNDISVGGKYALIPQKLSLNLTGHYFMSNQEDINGDSDFGTEIDLDLVYKPNKKVVVKSGVSTFMQGKAMETLWDGRDDTPYWAYAMVVVKF